MRIIKNCLYLALLVSAATIVGCNADNIPDVPVNNGPHAEGTPEERIARIQQDPMLTPEQKELRINFLKKKFNIK